MVENRQTLVTKNGDGDGHNEKFGKRYVGDFDRTNSWIESVTECIKDINKIVFCLNDMYVYEERLVKRYPNNKVIRSTIRKTLQDMRDIGLIDFSERGRYQITPDFLVFTRGEVDN